MAVILSNNLLRLDDLGAWIRNTNISYDARQDKAGPHGIAFDGTKWRAYFEAADATVDYGGGTFIFNTGVMLATADVLQGPWTIVQSALVVEPNITGWENRECSPSAIYWDAVNNRWVIWYHGGNNSGSVGRQIGVMYSTDGATGLKFTKDAANPILTLGTSGATDDKGVSDLKIQRKADGTYLGFYTGRKVGGVANGTIHRVTGTSPNTLTKQGEVIAAGAASSWNDAGQYPGEWWIDTDNRLHMIVAAPSPGNGAAGYYYSDDSGATWTQYGSNPILTGVGGGVSYASQSGDVGQGVYDGDVLVFTTGGKSSSFPTNPPMTGEQMAITPARVTSPKRKGKFYLPVLSGTRSYTAVTGTSLMSQSTFSVIGRFKAYRLARSTQYREIYTDEAAFNILSFVRIEGGAGNDAGKLTFYFRTPTAEIVAVPSGVQVDDGLYHTFMFRRVSAALFELWLDGAKVATSTTNPSTDATASFKAVGNWHPTTGEPDEPARCTISDLVTIAGTAVSWQQASEIIRNRTFPIGITADIDFPTAGTDFGDAVVVEAALNPTITTQPADASADVGGAATFTIAASGTAPYSYQWTFKGANVGTNSATYTRTGIVSSDQRGVVACTVTDANGATVSRNAILTLNPANVYLWTTVVP